MTIISMAYNIELCIVTLQAYETLWRNYLYVRSKPTPYALTQNTLKCKHILIFNLWAIMIREPTSHFGQIDFSHQKTYSHPNRSNIYHTKKKRSNIYHTKKSVQIFTNNNNNQKIVFRFDSAQVCKQLKMLASTRYRENSSHSATVTNR